MVDHAVGIADRDRRQQCANAIIAIMKRMFPHSTDSVDNERKLWDHLALMSDFKLDIDYPYDVEQAQTIHAKPEPMSYPMRQIPVRHYGNMMFELFGRLKTMPAGKERDELIRLVANQMKRDLTLWGHGSSDDEKVASDLAEYTDGKVQLDLGTFKFDRTVIKDNDKKRKKK